MRARVASLERQTMSQRYSWLQRLCESLAKFIEIVLSSHFQEADDVAKEWFSRLG